MYPYNRKTQIYNTPIRAKEASAKEKQEASLSSDRRLQELLSLSQQETHQIAKKYEALMAEPALDEAKDILKTMYLDTLKHLRRLQEVIFMIFSDNGTSSPPELSEPEITSDGKNLLEELLLTEMDDMNFYRNLFFAMPEGELRDAFFEILTDKQNHCNGLNYLYAKYFTETTGN